MLLKESTSVLSREAFFASLAILVVVAITVVSVLSQWGILFYAPASKDAGIVVSETRSMMRAEKAGDTEKYDSLLNQLKE